MSSSTLKTASTEEQAACRTPSSPTQVTYIDRWKYDLVRHAILNVVPDDDIGIMFKQLPAMVRSFLSKETRQRLGAISRYTTLVKLDMEVRGEIERIAGMRPQYLKRTCAAVV